MPRRRRAVNPEEAARDTIGLEIERMIDTLAKAEGPAADAESVSDERLVRQWGQRDPNIQDVDALKQALMTQGLPPEVLDPNSPQCLALLKANPDLAQDWAGILSTPLDERMADLVAPLVEHPLRLGILRPYADNPKEMVKVSDSFDAKWGRLVEQQMGGAPPIAAAPVPPEQALPSMPQAPVSAPAPQPVAPMAANPQMTMGG